MDAMKHEEAGAASAAVVDCLRPWARLFPAIILLLGVVVYANTFNVPSELDDGHYIFQNPAIRDFRFYFDNALAERAMAQGSLDPNFRTRIVTYFTFALNYRLHGLELAGYHIANLLVHLLNGLLVFWLVRATLRTPFFMIRDQQGQGAGASGPRLLALFAALFFVAHPVQTEAVTYLSQRFTSLAALLYLLSLLLYSRWRLIVVDHEATRDQSGQAGGGAWRLPLYWSAVLVAVLAMLTKEIAFTLPLIIILYEWMFFGGLRRKRLGPLLPFVASLPIIPLIIFGRGAEYTDVSRLSASLAGSGADNTALTYLFTQFRVIVTYLRLLVLPINQNLDYDFPRSADFLQAPVWGSFLFLCLLAGVGVYLYRRSTEQHAPHGRWQRLMAFGIFWFFLALSVESTVMPLRDVIFEHRLYLPSVGFFLVLLGGVEIVRERLGGRGNAVCTLLLVAAVGALAAATYSRNSIWANPIALWEDTARHSPNKSRPHNALGELYVQEGRYEEAIHEYELALRFSPSPEDSMLYHNGLEGIYLLLGNRELVQRNYEANLQMFLQALEKRGEDSLLLTFLGFLYTKMQRWDEAEDAFRRAIKVNGAFGRNHANLGRFYLGRNRPDEALAALREAERLDPEGDDVQESIGDALAAKGEQAAALKAYVKTQELNPDLDHIYSKIADLYARLGNLEAAGKVLRQATEVRRDDPKRYFILGAFYDQMTNHSAEAEQAYLRSIELDGSVAVVHMKLGALYVKQGAIDRGLESLQQAANLDPSIPEIYYNFGLAYSAKGDLAAAATAYEQVLSLAPLDEAARQKLEEARSLRGARKSTDAPGGER